MNACTRVEITWWHCLELNMGLTAAVSVGRSSYVRRYRRVAGTTVERPALRWGLWQCRQLRQKRQLLRMQWTQKQHSAQPGAPALDALHCQASLASSGSRRRQRGRARCIDELPTSGVECVLRRDGGGVTQRSELAMRWRRRQRVTSHSAVFSFRQYNSVLLTCSGTI